MYAIVDATQDHLHALALSMRKADRDEVKACGMSPIRALKRSWEASVIRRAAIIDGEIGAVWGCGGSLIGYTGRPWMLTAPIIETVKLAFVREARGEVRDMLLLYPYLETRVIATYRKALGLLEILGFQIDEPEPFGPKGVPFCRVWMRRSEPALRFQFSTEQSYQLLVTPERQTVMGA